MAKASFMSMRWLRQNVKAIIYATVSLFVLSIFAMGYGSSSAVRRQEERQQQADDAERRSDSLRNAAPPQLRDRLNHPVAHISYPAANASLTAAIDVRTMWRVMSNSPEYQQLSQMPEGIREYYGNMIKDQVLDTLITSTLVDLYAQANTLKPQISETALIEAQKQQISPVEFDRKLRREGMTEADFGRESLKKITMQTVAQSVVSPIPTASATEDFLKNYFETNKEKFRKEDLISFDHLLIAPSDFAGRKEISEDEIKDYYDKNRSKFMSSKRISASQILVRPFTEDFLATVNVKENDIRLRYSDNLSKYKVEEKINASHILIKPRNNFDLKLNDFSINARNFVIENKGDHQLVTFAAGISSLTDSSRVELDHFAIKTADGQVWYATNESMDMADNSLSLPLSGGTKPAVFGSVAILINQDSEPAELLIKDNSSEKSLDISAAFDADKAMKAAETKVKSILERARAGEDFAQLARDLSQDAGSAANGGELGDFGRGAMVKPFEDAAFSATIGQITEPVKTQFGYHIIKVNSRIPERTKSLDEVRAVLTEEIRRELAEIKAITVLEEIRRKVVYNNDEFETHAKLHSVAQSRNKGGKLPVFYQGEINEDYSEEQRRILLADIGNNDGYVASEIEERIFNLNPGELSDVIQTGEEFHLFKIHEVLEPIQLSLTGSVKNEIRQTLEFKSRELQAKETAERLKAERPTASVVELAENFDKLTPDDKISFKEMPFMKNPGFTSFSLADGTGQFSHDGRTYAPEIHKAILGLSKSGNWENQIAGPIKSELGYHFVQLTAYDGDRFEDFEDMKEDIRRIVTLEPSEEDILKFFEENKDSFAQPATRQLRQIVVSEESQANEVYERLQNGEIFALLANRFSMDGSAPQGGLINPVRKGQLSADLDAAVWELKTGEFTKPIKTTYGFVIALLDADETPGVEPSLNAQVRAGIRRQLKNNYQELSWSYFLRGLNNKAHVIRHPQILSEI